MTTVLQYYPNYPFQRKINGTITRTTISNISEESSFPANHEIPIEKKPPIEVSIIVDWDGPDDAANPTNWSST
jgi:hypothetical protein